ncbi:MAG: hypothetical protein M1820_004714 [Bogoriella megaspora]|nr:MAG: hypothetical protein M1820_004714 [Bogoriella megaspora]
MWKSYNLLSFHHGLQNVCIQCQKRFLFAPTSKRANYFRHAPGASRRKLAKQGSYAVTPKAREERRKQNLRPENQQFVHLGPPFSWLMHLYGLENWTVNASFSHNFSIPDSWDDSFIKSAFNGQLSEEKLDKFCSNWSISRSQLAIIAHVISLTGHRPLEREFALHILKGLGAAAEPFATYFILTRPTSSLPAERIMITTARTHLEELLSNPDPKAHLIQARFLQDRLKALDHYNQAIKFFSSQRQSQTSPTSHFSDPLPSDSAQQPKPHPIDDPKAWRKVQGINFGMLTEASALYERGMFLFERGDHEASLRDFTRAIEEFDDPRACFSAPVLLKPPHQYCEWYSDRWLELMLKAAKGGQTGAPGHLADYYSQKAENLAQEEERLKHKGWFAWMKASVRKVIAENMAKKWEEVARSALKPSDKD